MRDPLKAELQFALGFLPLGMLRDGLGHHQPVSAKCLPTVPPGGESRTPNHSVHYLVDWNFHEDRSHARSGFGHENLTRFAMDRLRTNLPWSLDSHSLTVIAKPCQAHHIRHNLPTPFELWGLALLSRESWSRNGNCYDNAPIESFWGSLKNEMVHRQRRHSRIGYLAPAMFAQSFTRVAA